MMTRFTITQLNAAKQIIKPHVASEHCDSFNGKIPLSVLNSNNALTKVKEFHNCLLDLCNEMFYNFTFNTPCQRKYINDTHLPALFMIWLQKDMPEIVRYCIDTCIQHCCGYEFCLITDDNVREYIDIPQYIYDAYISNKICSADYSDYIRIKLLEMYNGIYFDATTLFIANIDERVMSLPYWSIKGNYQKNTYPIAMLNFNFGQIYALGGYDNTYYSYVRQMLDYYYSNHQYCFSYYMVYYFFQYVYSTNKKIKQFVDIRDNMCEDCEQLAYHLKELGNYVDNWPYTDTFFYKLRSSDDYSHNFYDFADNLLKIIYNNK